MATQGDGHTTQPRTDKLNLEIVTPKGAALTLDVDEVTAPSVQGEFGVLPGHLPILAALRTGLVSYRVGTDIQKCAVGRGFVEVGPDKVSILTDRFVEREGVDPVLVRKALGEVQQQIARAEGDAVEPTREDMTLDALIQEENWLAAELELYGDPPPATMRPFEAYGPTPGPDDDDVPTDTTGQEPGDGAPVAKPDASRPN